MLASKISLSKPFTRATLNIIRSTLISILPASDIDLNASPSPVGHIGQAAVFVSLCNVNNIPGILLQVRGGKLREHSGEISFPGGSLNPGESISVAALRETEEELGIPRSQLEILGALHPAEFSRSGKRVWPFVGYIHTSSEWDNALGDEHAPLPSLSLSSLVLSKTEVASVFHLPLSHLPSSPPPNPRLRRDLFRASKPYWVVDVLDCASPGVKEGGEGEGVGKVEVWGLTGWYLNLLMRALGVWKP